MSAYTTLVDDPWGRPTPAAEPPSCPLCPFGPIAAGEAWTLDGDVYCMSHGILSAAAVLDEHLTGEGMSPKILEDARFILFTAIRLSGGSPSAAREG